jgi:hypothetical protein
MPLPEWVGVSSRVPPDFQLGLSPLARWNLAEHELSINENFSVLGIDKLNLIRYIYNTTKTIQRRSKYVTSTLHLARGKQVI